MKIRLRVFAYLRETIGKEEEEFELEEGTRVGEFWLFSYKIRLKWGVQRD